MKQPRPIPWLMTIAGLVLLAMPGCSTKWLSGGCESEFPNGERSASEGTTPGEATGSSASASNGSTSSTGSTDADPSGDAAAAGPDGSIPSLSARGYGDSAVDGGSLRGFDRLAPGQMPSEERLQDGAISPRMLSTDAADKRMAELRREEEAAIAAGFKDAFFGYDRYSIEDEAREALSRDADWIRDHPKALVKISGHCDERGTQDYNLVLGDKRAKAAKRYLIDLGVDPQQVTTISFGKNRPFCAEHDESCYRQNRRGHFLLSQ